MNTKALFLFEKPSQSSDFAKIVGGTACRGYWDTPAGILTHCIGHLLEIEDPEESDASMKGWRMERLPWVPATIPLPLVPKARTREQLQLVTKLIQTVAKQQGTIVLATDPDREGEAIGRETLAYAKYRGPVRRLWLSSLDAQSVRRELAAIRDGKAYEAYGQAARSRGDADFVLGVNFTRFFTLRADRQAGVFSVGRVQTPTLWMIVAREREIAEFQPQKHFRLSITVATKDSTGSAVDVMLQFPFETAQPAQPRPSQDAEGNDEEEASSAARLLTDKDLAERILAEVKGVKVVLAVHRSRRAEGPPALHTLLTLQQACNRRFGWSSAKTLEVAQACYERHKCISYPRTECKYLPEELKGDVGPTLAHLARTFPAAAVPTPIIRPSVFNSEKAAQEPHYAIIPTLARAPWDAMNEDERQLYQLVAAHYLAALLPDAVAAAVIMTTDAAGVRWGIRGSTPVSAGWRQAFQWTGAGGMKAADNPLPQVDDGTGGTVSAASSKSLLTEPPPLYTEATLLAAMKNAGRFVSDPAQREQLTKGLGTGATRAAIISTLKDRGYIELRRKALVSTEKGRALIGAIEKTTPLRWLADPGETAVWEGVLGKIEKGEAQGGRDLLAPLFERIASSIRALRGNEATAEICPKSNSPVRDLGSYYLFDGWPSVRCWKELFGRKMSIQEYGQILSNPDGISLSGFRWKSGKTGSAKLRFDPTKNAFTPVFEERSKRPAFSFDGVL